MADKKELYGYEEEDILTLEFDDGVEEECTSAINAFIKE